MIIKKSYYWPDNIQDKDVDIILTGQILSLRYILKSWERTGTVIQAGGSYGIWPLKLATKFDKVYTFEPDPISFECLVNNCSSFENIVKFQMALGTNNEEVFLVRKAATQHHIEKELNSGYMLKYKKQITSRILCASIDSFNFSECDALLLDTEGYELLALKGAVAAIRKFKPLVLIQREVDNFETDKFMKELGYKTIEDIGSDRIYMP